MQGNAKRKMEIPVHGRVCTVHEAASFLSQQLPGIEYGGGMVDCRGKTSYYFDCDATTIRSVALICAN